MSVRDDIDQPNEMMAHSASKDCCSPVPEMTTSHSASLAVSMLKLRVIKDAGVCSCRRGHVQEDEKKPLKWDRLLYLARSITLS
jgi:hypothetical protein